MEGGRKNAFEVKWRIRNIRSWLQTRDDALYSPQFLAEPLMNTRWKLSLSTNWQFAEKYLCLTLLRDIEDDGPEWIPLNYELSFLASDESPIKSKSRHKKFALKTESHELNVKQVDILEDKKELYCPEGVLTVCCEFWKAWSSILKTGLCSIRSVIGRKCITLEAPIHNYSRLVNNSKRTVNFTSTSTEINLISFDVSVNCFWEVTFERTELECKRFKLYSCRLFALKNDGNTEYLSTNNLSTLLSLNIECTFSFKKDILCTPEYLINDTVTLRIKVKYNPGVQSEFIEYDEINYDKMVSESADELNLNISNPDGEQSIPSVCQNLSDHESYDFEKNDPSDEGECFNIVGNRHLPTTTLKEDLTSLCNDHLFCDTKLQTDSETFPAHRNVLSARSPVFKKMFTTDMKEKAGECINIPDISSDTVRRMIQFIYTDCIDNLDMQSAKDLYVASDKYDIASLKQRCLSFMKKNLCPSNVCEVLVLAEMHQDKNLKSAAQQFVLTYSKEVLGSNEWKLFMKDFGSLAAEVMYFKFMNE